MEKRRTTLAIALAFAFLLVWQTWIAPRFRPPPPPKVEPVAESRPIPETSPSTPSSTRPSALARPYVESTDVVRPELTNEHLRLTFSNVGGVLESAKLLGHRRMAGSDEPLELLKRYRDAARALELRAFNDATAYLHEQPWKVSASDARSVEFTLEPGVGTFDRPYRLVKRVSLAPDAPVAEVVVRLEALDASARRGAPFELKLRFTPSGGLTVDSEAYGAEDLQWLSSAHFAVEPNGKENYKEITLAEVEKFDAADRNAEGLRSKRFSLAGSRRYVADLNSYFGVFAAITEMPSAETSVSVVGVQDPDALGERAGHPVRTRSDVEFGLAARQGEAPAEAKFTLYFGPKDESVLERIFTGDRAALGEDFSRTYRHALGFFGFVARAVLWLLNALHSVVGNWGWAIVLMTLCVRILLFPINRKSQAGMLRHQESMARIKPKIDALKAKYGDDRAAFGRAQMELMRAEKVPMMPLGGCLPIFLQMPIFFGLFTALRSTIDLRQASFLWAKDLSQPDHLIRFDTPVPNPLTWLASKAGVCCCMPPGSSLFISGLHLFPLLMTAAWVLQTTFAPKPANETPEAAQQRKMMLVMPFVFGLTMYGYGAALSLYWLTSSLVGMVESRIIKRQLRKKGVAVANAGPPARR
ncbi:MAG TPA: YidC/Oxa1 family insertase periplasmic-domain containing protein [Planctomycetota bacterium]|nr:YidC/Oxa1 family insertase periplasmic-domain containing protein [Planctomycetota bacterium]